MAGEDRILPTEINLDVSPLYLGKDKARFIRNWDYASFGGQKEGENAGVYRRLQVVDAYDASFTLPAASGYTTIGKKLTPENNELYVCAYHSGGKHCIYRVVNGRCEVVATGPELEFSNDPQYFFSTGRFEVFIFSKGEVRRTFLVLTDGQARQHFVCVEDSIATHSFNATQFPRLRGSYDRRELFALGVISPTDCIEIIPVLTTDADAQNEMKQATWRWRLLYRDVYGRQSEHGVISDLYYVSDCAGTNAGCVDLRFSAGNALVQEIVVEYQKSCNGNWFAYDTLILRTNCDRPWYEQPMRSDIGYSAATNKITYRFCANKGCVSVDKSETDRVENPMPRKSQSLLPLGSGLALAGNQYGFKPFSCDLLGKVKFSVEKPLADNAAITPTRSIVIYAYIYSPHNFNQRLQSIWDKDGMNVFGGRNAEDILDNVGTSYGQRFATDDQDGFIGFLHGTEYTTLSKQYRLSGIDADEEATALILGGSITTGEWVEHGVASAEEARYSLFIQRFEFRNVPAGRYLFRIASHRASLNDGYKATSTYYFGHTKPNGKLPTLGTAVEARELVVDVCEKDYDSYGAGQLVELWDLTFAKDGIDRPAKVTDGYIYETRDEDRGVLPIGGAWVDMAVTGDAEAHQTRQTDHNGFFFTTAKDKQHSVSLSVFRKCQKSFLGNLVWHRSESGGRKTSAFYATDIWRDFTIEACNRVLVRGRAVDCETGSGLQNITVVVEGGGATTTNRHGDWELVVYDQSAIPSRPRIYYYSGICRVTSCTGRACFDPFAFRLPACTDCAERVVLAEEIHLKNNTSRQRGLQLGSRRRLALKGGDWMDRKNYAQTQDSYIIDIPSAAEIGGFAYPRIKCTIAPDAVFPAWMKTLYINISKNLAYSDMLSWVADRIEFIDNTGNVNKVAPTQIRIHYSSLSEYNKQHNFATNSTWQFLEEKDMARITDRVQFIANGDNQFFKTPITELVRFDKDGQYFLVDFRDDLKNLKAGALIKLLRPFECQTEEAYYEICGSIPIVGGKPERYEFYVEAVDSYFVYRQIPTPVVTTHKIKKSTTDGNGVITITEEEESTTTNTIYSYSWPFEHHSPSDLWGEKCNNFGRVSVKNPLEDVIIKWDEIAPSGALGTNSLANYLHFFDESRKKSFGRQYNITACLIKGNTVLAICESNYFLIKFDENAVRTDEQTGRAVVLSAEKQLGKPYAEGEFGCRKADINAISSDGNTVHWIDGNKIAEVFCNFQKAEDVSRERFKSFLRSKIKSIDRHNAATRQLKRYLHSEINPKDNQCYVSDFHLGARHFINDADNFSIEENETYCLVLSDGGLRKFCSFTPELMAPLPGDSGDEQFLVFKDGLPYKLYRPNSAVVNTFFGVVCQSYLRIVYTFDPLTVQQPLCLKIFSSNVVLYSPEVLSGFGGKSRIPRNWFKRGDKYYVAPFLCDIKANEKILFGGERLRGRYVEVLLQSDPDKKDVYTELTGIIIKIIQP